MLFRLLIAWRFFLLTFPYLYRNGSLKNIAAKALLGHTFRIPEKGRSDFLIVPRIWLRTLSNEVNKKEDGNVTTKKNVFLDNLESSLQTRYSFLELFGFDENIEGISRESLRKFSSWYDRVLFGLISFPMMIIQFGRSIYRKDKAPFASFFEEMLEVINFVSLVRKCKIREAYIFCTFEKDTNAFFIFLDRLDVRVFKIPSEVPLSFWNKKLLTHDLLACTGLQLEEAELFESVRYDRIRLTGPEKAYEIAEKFKENRTYPAVEANAMRTVSYISTGGWVREKLGHADQGVTISDQEKRIIHDLSEYCLQNGCRLLIYLHPREKKLSHERLLNEFYNDLGVFEFADKSLKSNESFQNSAVSVSFMSTLMYERLYFGFKGLLFLKDGFNEEFKDLSIDRICVRTTEELSNMLDKALSSSSQSFFEEFGITHYCWFNQNVNFTEHVRNSGIS